MILIGFGLANYVVNDRVTDKQIATNEGRGYYSYDVLASDYVPIQHDELNVELKSYLSVVTVVDARSNLQYIYQPLAWKKWTCFGWRVLALRWIFNRI